MDLRLTPAPLRGRVTPPPSKSMLHRVLIASALSGRVLPESAEMSDDVRATCRAVEGLLSGAKVLACGESASTLRFLLPLAMSMDEPPVFRCAPGLLRRPLADYAPCAREGELLRPLRRLTEGEYLLAGDVSSQFVSGLLFALPRLRGESRIVLTAPLVSRGYAEMTERILARFGVEIFPCAEGYRVPGGQRYRFAGMTVERDWSAAAYFLVLRALGCDVTVDGMTTPSLQGDARAETLCREGLPPVLDMGDIPDLLPPLALLAALTPGRETRFSNAARLRAKESDRLAAVAGALRALGCEARETADGLFVRGTARLSGGTVDSCGDHRIAMLAGIAAPFCEKSVTVRGADCVRKSYPGFWEALGALGMEMVEC